MRLYDSIRLVALGAATVAVAAPAATAQRSQGLPVGWYSVNGYVSHYWLDPGDARSRVGATGGGVRFMVTSGGMVGATRHWLRLGIGAFVEGTAERSSLSTRFVGGEVAVHLRATPIAGVVDPLVSLGAGGFTTGVVTGSGALRSTTSDTKLALSPAAGALLHLTNLVAFRADVRAPVVFAEARRAHYEVAVGASVNF